MGLIGATAVDVDEKEDEGDDEEAKIEDQTDA